MIKKPVPTYFNFFEHVIANTYIISYLSLQALLLFVRMIKALHKKWISIKDFYSKCDQIRGFLCIWSHLLKKFLIENFTFFLFLTIHYKFYYFKDSKGPQSKNWTVTYLREL